MENAEQKTTDPKLLRSAVEIFIHLTLIALMAVWCFRIFQPFLVPVVWGMIIAVALFPVFARLRKLLGGRSGLTGIVFTLVALTLIIWPTVLITQSAVGSLTELADRVDTGTLEVPPPPESVAGWPVIGEQVDEVWRQASTNLQSTVERYDDQIRTASLKVLGIITGLGVGILQSILAIIIAGFMLTYAEGGHAKARHLMARVGGERGADLADLSAATVRSVAQGVLGVALVQALLAAIGMGIAGIPGWGLWTVLVLGLAVVQLPPLLVLLPVAIWAISSQGATTGTIIFAIYALLVSMSDTFLKPLFLGRGLEIPMPVILIGAIGGMMLSGIIGLFVGAVILAIGWKMFKAWLDPDWADAAVAELQAEEQPAEG